MNELVVADKASDWRKLKALVLDSVSSPITHRVYNLGLDEFIAWFVQEPRPAGFTKATVTAWRVALEARKLGPVSINVRITAVRKLAVEAADNGLLAPELASGIARIKGVRSHGVRVGNWLSLRQAQALLNAPDVATKKGLRDRAMFATLPGCGLRRSELANLTTKHVQQRDNRWYIAGAGLPDIAPHDLRRTTAKLCRAAGGELEQIQLLLGHSSVQTTERYLGTKQDLTHAPNDAIKLKLAV
jgi:site-specific recombinase XerD